ncbi:MAG: LacI family DNA-binding transcriptional regulator [Actinomycetota bacterium]|nr:LacI family DNA-binding transcriptional regulator [Actinomycetota bacterium]
MSPTGSSRARRTPGDGPGRARGVPDGEKEPRAATRRVTLAEVARRAGVSQTTASFVLSGRREEMRISAQVEAKILRAVEETGYRPNVVSRSLRTGSSHTIGFVSDTVATTPFAGHLIWGALDAAREQGRLLLIAETEGDAELETQLVETMRDRQVEGIVLASMYTRWANVPRALLGGPSVLLNALSKKETSVPSVIPDEAEAGRCAARLLLEAGHREGIYVVGVGVDPVRTPKGSVAACERLAGIEEAFGREGVRLSGGAFLGDWQPHGGYEATRGILSSRKQVRALICFNDRVSVGAYQAVADAGLEVARDVSVVSFDDEPVASWLRPGLTSVALPHYELGRKAIEVLLALDGASGSGKVHRVEMPLRVRESVGRSGAGLDRPARRAAK